MVPYIGVTGVMTPQEARHLQQNIPTQPCRDLMAGVLVSSKTLKGQKNKHPRQFPLVERVAEIFQGHLHVLNLIHYSTDEPNTLASQLNQLADLGGQLLDGLQLNMVWPHISHLELYKEAHPGHVLVLQISREATEPYDNSPEKVAEVIGLYVPFIDAILLDASKDRGQPLDVEQVSLYLSAIADCCYGLGLGVAGGLYATEIHRLEPLFRQFPDLSIDAQGKLRDPETDDLNVFKACQYFLTVHQTIERVKAEEERRKHAPSLIHSNHPEWEADIGDD